MIKIALTGSIGMGKSAVAKMFVRAGIPLFDADQTVRALQAPGGALVEEIGNLFPGTVEDGILDRDKLAAAALGNREALARLEALVHPAVDQARHAFIAAHADRQALFFDIPLLFETGAEVNFDKVIVVSAPAAVQRTRVLTRSGMSPAKLDSILSRQMADSDKRDRADFIINTSGDLAATEAQVRKIIACLGLGVGG